MSLTTQMSGLGRSSSSGTLNSSMQPHRRPQALLSCGCGDAHPLNSCGGATDPVTVQLRGQQTVSQSATLNANIGVDIEGISIGGGASTTDETSVTVTYPAQAPGRVRCGDEPVKLTQSFKLLISCRYVLVALLRFLKYGLISSNDRETAF